MKIRFAKSLVAFCILCAFNAICCAQSPCEIRAKSAPLLLDLKLEMSPAEAQIVFGRALKIKIKKKGERTFFQNFVKNPAPDSLRGTRALYLRFFDLKLYQIEIFYEPRTDLETLEIITNKLAAQFDFSASDWKTMNNQAEIRCGETSLAVDNVLNPRIELTDEIVRVAIEERRKKDQK